LDPDHELVLEPSEAQHVMRVLRRRRGDKVVLADGEGAVASAVLETVTRDGVVARVSSVERHPTPAGCSLVLGVGVLAAQAMDWAVQKAGELGCERLVPLLCERCQHAQTSAQGRMAHWRRISRQTIKQCHRPWCLQIEELTTLQELATRFARRGLVADPHGAHIRDLGLQLPTALAVGPEGGLTPGELALLDAAGWRRLQLGRYVLRSETAVVAGAAVVLGELERGS